MSNYSMIVMINITIFNILSIGCSMNMV